MIRINLLAVERARTKRRAVFDIGQKITVLCSLILVLAVVFIGWRYWTATRQSDQLDTEIAKAQDETARLHSIIQQVQQFEQRRAQLQQRVTLIEQLRKGQTGPVHLLDQVSRALPTMLWLTQIKQTGDDVAIEGRSTVLTGLSDFVTALETSGYFQRSIEIVSTTTEASPQAPGDLIKFSIKARFQTPGEARAAEAAKPGAKAGAKP